MAEPDFEALECALGSAARVEKLLDQLFGRNADRRDFACSDLEDALGRGWWSASGPALAVMFDRLPKAPEPDLVLSLAAELASSGTAQHWARSDELDAARLDVLRDGFSALERAARSKDARARAGASEVLVLVPGEASVELLEMLAGDDEPVVRAGALLALARANPTSAAGADALEDEDEVVSGSAFVAAVRRTNGAIPSSAGHGLRAWLGWRQPRPDQKKKVPRLTWFGGLGPGRSSVRGLASACRSGDPSGDELIERVDVLVETLDDPSAWEGLQLAEAVLQIAAMPSQQDDDAVRFDRLDPLQQHVGRLLADRWWLPWAASGLPAAGGPRRRWAGLDEPGPLDLEVELDGESGPLWWHWLRIKRKHTSSLVPPPFEEHLPAEASRWRAAIEFFADGYTRKPAGPTRSRILPGVEAVAGDADALAAVEQLADELVRRRLATIEADEPSFSSAVGALLLLPWIRAGRDVKATWRTLVPIEEKYAYGVELLRALPLADRTALLRGHLEGGAAYSLVPRLKTVIELLPACPDADVVKAIRAGLADVPEERRAEVEGMLSTIAAEHADVAALVE